MRSRIYGAKTEEHPNYCRLLANSHLWLISSEAGLGNSVKAELDGNGVPYTAEVIPKGLPGTTEGQLIPWNG